MAKSIFSQVGAEFKQAIGQQLNQNAERLGQHLGKKISEKMIAKSTPLEPQNTQKPDAQKPYRQANLKFKMDVGLEFKKKTPNGQPKIDKKQTPTVQANIGQKNANLSVEKELKLSFKPFKSATKLQSKSDGDGAKTADFKQSYVPTSPKPNLAPSSSDPIRSNTPIRPKLKAPKPPNITRQSPTHNDINKSKTPPPRPPKTYLSKFNEAISQPKTYLQKNEFTILPMAKDGNCLFHAFASDNKTPKATQNMRNDLAKIILIKQDDLKKDTGFQAFLSQIEIKSTDLLKSDANEKLSSDEKQNLQIKALAEKARMPNFWNDDKADIFMPLLSVLENKNVNLYRPTADGNIKFDEHHSIKRNDIFKAVSADIKQNMGEINLLYSNQNHFDLLKLK